MVNHRQAAADSWRRWTWMEGFLGESSGVFRVPVHGAIGSRNVAKLSIHCLNRTSGGTCFLVWEVGYVVNLRGEEVVAEHVNVAGERGGFVVPPNEEVFITKGQGVPMEPLTAIRIESRAGELIGEVRADGEGEGLLVAVFPEGVYRIPLELIEQRGESRRYVGPWGGSKPKEDWVKFLKRRKEEILGGE